MDWSNLTLNDIYRLLVALEQNGGEQFIRGLINRVVPPINFINGRVTINSLLRLLQQTGGSTILPDHIVELLNQPEPPPLPGLTWGQAHQIMGPNILLPPVVEQHYKVRFTPEEAHQLMTIPFSAATLEKYRHTHMLFPGYPLSMADIQFRTQLNDDGDSVFDSNDWYCEGEKKFGVIERVGLRWYLLRKEVVPNSCNQTFSNQERLLDPDEEIPRACELCYGIILWRLATGEYLLPEEYARCRDWLEEDDDDGIGPVYLGNFDDEGIGVYYGTDQSRADDEPTDGEEGLASSVRLPE